MDLFAVGLSADLRVLEITALIAAKTNDLPESFQGDPFDQTILATAAALNLTLITADPAIRNSGACRVIYYPFHPSWG